MLEYILSGIYKRRTITRLLGIHILKERKNYKNGSKHKKDVAKRE